MSALAVGAQRKCTTCAGFQECIIGNFWQCLQCDVVRMPPAGRAPADANGPRVDFFRTAISPRKANGKLKPDFSFWVFDTLAAAHTHCRNRGWFDDAVFITVYRPLDLDSAGYPNETYAASARDWCPVPGQNP